MNGTRNIPGTNFCGIILDNGKDCPNQVDPDAPLNLCGQHFQEAFEWQRRVEVRPPAQASRCPVCGEQSFYDAVGGRSCRMCGHAEPGVTMVYAATGSEMESRRADVRAAYAQAHLKQVRVDVVYYLRFGDRIKIGTSGTFRKRKEAIPHDEVLALELGGVSIEHRRHVEFGRFREVGEWFRAEQPLLDHVARLNTAPWTRLLAEWERQKL